MQWLPLCKAWHVTGVDINDERIRPTVYPNPASDVMYVLGGDVRISRVSIYDLNGRKVVESTVPESQAD